MLLLWAMCAAAQARVCSIVDYGAVGDGRTINTIAITAAVESCGMAGGGTVLVPSQHGNGSSVFMTGSFVLSYDDLELRVEAGATLRGTTDERHYPLMEPLPSYGIGRDIPTSKRYRSLVRAGL